MKKIFSILCLFAMAFTVLSGERALAKSNVNYTNAPIYTSRYNDTKRITKDNFEEYDYSYGRHCRNRSYNNSESYCDVNGYCSESYCNENGYCNGSCDENGNGYCRRNNEGRAYGVGCGRNSRNNRYC